MCLYSQKKTADYERKPFEAYQRAIFAVPGKVKYEAESLTQNIFCKSSLGELSQSNVGASANLLRASDAIF